MKVAVLGSGSGGNAAVIKAQDTTMLVDAGLSARQLSRRLDQIGVDPDSLDGILLTHEHRDHTCGLEVFLRKRSTPVFTTALTRESLGDRITDGLDWRIFQHGQVFKVGEVTVEAFSLPHDAVDPVGFVCRSGDSCIGVATDFGFITNLVRERLKGVHALLVEANYDDKMLDADSKRPWSIKQRISSRHGHLSNQQTADLVEGLLDHGLRTVILGHLSGDCNCPDVAVSAIRKIGTAKGLEKRLGVHVASQAEPTSWFEIGGEEAEERPAPTTTDQMDLAIGTHL